MRDSIDKESYRRNLPHIQRPGAPLFVTFRLADSLPRSLLLELEGQHMRQRSMIERIADPEQRESAHHGEERRYFGKWEGILDTSQEGPRWLSDCRIASLAVSTLHSLDRLEYDLEAFC